MSHVSLTTALHQTMRGYVIVQDRDKQLDVSDTGFRSAVSKIDNRGLRPTAVMNPVMAKLDDLANPGFDCRYSLLLSILKWPSRGETGHVCQ